MTNAELKEKMSLAIHKPTTSMALMLDWMEGNLGNDFKLVDPNNPWVLMMETIAANGVAAIDHNLMNLSKRYAVLCNNIRELRPHLNQSDFKDLYAKYGSATFTVMLPYVDILKHAIMDDSNLYKKLVIPKDTEVNAGDIYRLSHAIEIRLYDTYVKVIYDISDETDIHKPESNVIPYRYLRSTDDYNWLTFDIKLHQLRKETHIYDSSPSLTFNKKIELVDSYSSLKAYHKINGSWVPLETTYNVEVFNPLVPSMSVEVIDKEVNLFIMPNYQSSGLIGSEIKVIVYSTIGENVTDLSTIAPGDFLTTLIDQTNDLDVYHKAFNKTSYSITSTDTVIGGRNALSFEEIKALHLSRSFGDPSLPVTSNNLSIVNTEKSVKRYNNTVAGRLYLVSGVQPTIRTPFYKSELSVGYVSLSSSFIDLQTKASTRVSSDGKRLFLLPSNVYAVDQFQVDVVDSVLVDAWKTLPKEALVNELKDKDYKYCPWLIALDSEYGSLQAHSYKIHEPHITDQSFTEHNDTTGLYINSATKTITLNTDTYDSYKFEILLEKDPTLDQIDQNNIYFQLEMVDSNGGRVYLISDTNVLTQNGRLLSATLETSMDIKDGMIEVTNCVDQDGTSTTRKIPLDSSLEIYYMSSELPLNSSFVVSDIDDRLVQTPLTPLYYGISQETFRLTLGEQLTHLWTDARPIGTSITYKRATEDIPAYYPETVLQTFDNGDGNEVPFQIGPNCEVSPIIAHNQGDPILINGEPVYQYRKGDFLLDEYGRRIPESEIVAPYVFTMMTMDYMTSIVEDVNDVTNRDLVLTNIQQESTFKISETRGNYLANTEVNYKPSISSGLIEVITDGERMSWIDSTVNGTILIKCSKSVTNNPELQKLMINRTMVAIDEYFNNELIDRQTLIETLLRAYDDGIYACDLKLNIFEEHTSFKLKNSDTHLTIKKLPYVTPSGLIGLKEDINVVFIPFLT